MGPSGSGKTTLLNILASVIPKKSLDLTGEVSSAPTLEPVFVQQEDLLFPQLTVFETLDTSAALRVARDDPATKKYRKSFVSQLLLDLSLKKTRDTKVGDAKTRGISGGEKKRLSIGNELLGSALKSTTTSVAHDPSGAASALIFADEPTSGLDSFQAEKVMALLKDMATNRGYTVVSSIHQPRTSIFAMFDDITLISEGRCIYSGPAQSVGKYFSGLGYHCPNNENPAEYYIDLISIDYSSPSDEHNSRERVLKLADAFTSHQKKQIIKIPDSFKPLAAVVRGRRHGGHHKFSVKRIFSNLKRSSGKFGILFRRAFNSVLRDKPLNIARFMSGLFSGLLFGCIYYKLGNGASTVADRLGLLQVAAVNTAMSALIKATTSFVTEKLIVQRERRSGAYSVVPYFFSKLLAEVPLSAFFPCMTGLIIYKLCGLNPAPGRLAKFLAILTVESIASSAFGMAIGSFAPSVESAIAISPAVMVIFIVFGGLYVVNTPSYLKWVPNTSLIRWAYEALCVNEFGGLVLKPEARYGPKSVSSGEQVLDSMGMGQSTIKGALKAQAAIILANYAFTLFSLIRQRPSYENVKSPPGHKKDKKNKKAEKGEGEGGSEAEEEEEVLDGANVKTISSSSSSHTTAAAAPKPPAPAHHR